MVGVDKADTKKEDEVEGRRKREFEEKDEVTKKKGNLYV